MNNDEKRPRNNNLSQKKISEQISSFDINREREK